MKKRTLLDQVEVKSPCTEDWNKMYGNDQVRFCEHCVKHVHDLSAMNRREAEKFVRKSNGAVCVRYTRRPDGKIQTVNDKLYQISSRASRMAAGIFGATLTLAASAYAQTENVDTSGDRAQVESRTINSEKKNRVEGTPGEIAGTVTDPNHAVVAGAQVTLTDQKTGYVRTAQTDQNGSYLLTGVGSAVYKLEIESGGFRTHTVENINYKGQSDVKYDASLDPDVAIAGGMAMIVEYENQLVRAVNDHDVDRVKLLIARNVNVNEKDGNQGLTALHIAVEKGDLEMVKMLLDAGARVNLRAEDGSTPLMKLGLNYYPDNSDSADENEDEADENQAVNSDAVAVDKETEDVEEKTDDSDAKTDKVMTDIFELLINHGAKVNLRNTDGMTALMYAAKGEYPVIVKLLLSRGASVNTQAKDGMTALMDAADEGAADNVEVLLKAGADVNIKDDDGETAMSHAYSEETKKLLSQYGAKEEVKDDEKQEDN